MIQAEFQTLRIDATSRGVSVRVVMFPVCGLSNTFSPRHHCNDVPEA